MPKSAISHRLTWTGFEMFRELAKTCLDKVNHLFLPQRLLFNYAGLVVTFHSNSLREHYSLNGLGVCNSSPERTLKLISQIQRRYRLLAFEEFVDMANKGKSLLGTALITFDDGYKSIYQDLYAQFRSNRTPFVVFINSCVTNNKKLLWTQKLSLILRAGRYNELANSLNSAEWPGLNNMSYFDAPSFSDIRNPFIDYYDHYLYEKVFDELLVSIGISEEEEAVRASLYLTSDELWEMRDLCTVGNHTHSHVNISNVTSTLLHQELTKCNDYIREIRTCIAPIPFAVPFGSRKFLSNKSQDIIQQHCQFIFTGYGYGNLHSKQSQFRRINGDNSLIKELDDVIPYITCKQDRRHCLSEWIKMTLGK